MWVLYSCTETCHGIGESGFGFSAPTISAVTNLLALSIKLGISASKENKIHSILLLAQSHKSSREGKFEFFYLLKNAIIPYRIEQGAY